MNEFTAKPQLSTPFPNVSEFWTCPKTNLKVPKNPQKNLEWRARLLKKAEQDAGLRQALYTASSLSLLYWINTFCWTFRIFEIVDGEGQQAEQAEIPFVTWDFQDDHILEIEKAIDKQYCLLSDKSRDMGATWDHIVVIDHKFIFEDNRQFLEISRVEKDVDDAANPKCLFSKHDFLHKFLPDWMLNEHTQIKRTKLHIQNLTNGSRIDGESSNKAAGTGDRKHAVLLDEFAKADNASAIKSSMLNNVSYCLLPNSTPFGPGTAYSKWRQSGQIKVHDLCWWDHPEKGKGRYVKQDEDTGRWTISSPWYERELELRSPQEMAQEVNRDHVGSGNLYFDVPVLEEHKRIFGCKPHTTRTIDFKKSVTLDGLPRIIQRSQVDRIDIRGRGKWQIWCPLIKGRPSQTNNYVIGCDISKGMGASNSVASVLCAETREKIMEFADSNVPPHEFARLVCAAALWIGGARKNGRPLIIWEANGDPGINFGREITKILQYPFVWMDRQSGVQTEKRTKRYGWHSNTNKKVDALGWYGTAIATGKYINHSIPALDEAITYVHYPDGNIGPSEWLDEKSNRRGNHGDRVIADMLANLGLVDSPRTRKIVTRTKVNTIGYRMSEWKKAKKQRQSKTHFDFSGTSHG